jgi:TonB-dependent receptor
MSSATHWLNLVPTHILRFCFILSCLLTKGLLGQNEAKPANEAGVVIGEVFDEDTKGPLGGVSVAVEKTQLETKTDAEGRFRIENVPVGEQVLLFFKAGYTRHRVTEVQILSEQIVKQDLVMAQDYADLEELDDFVITASDAMDISIELLKERQKESSFVDSIGKEMFSKIGAGDAASALTKVTGVTIQGGKYAVVRGLGGRYSNTTLNGVLLPSPDPDKKAVHMDLFPTGLLESIVTAKTFTPDMPGDFSGGSVNLRTKSMPEAMSFSSSISIGYNPDANFIDDFLGERGGQDDWMGMDDGTRQLPEFVRGLDASDWPYRPRRHNSDNHVFFQKVTDAFSKSVVPRHLQSKLNHGFSANFQNRWDLSGKIPFGVVGSLSYSRDYKHYSGGIAQRMSVTDSGQESVSAKYFPMQGGEQDWGPASSIGDNQSIDEVTWGGLAEANLELSKNSKLKISLLHNQATEDKSRVMEGFEVGRSSSNSETLFSRDYYDERVRITALHYIERSLGSVHGKGIHQFPEFNDSKIEWNWAASSTTQSEPDVRFVNAFYSFLEEDTSFPKQGVEPRRIFRDLTEISRSFDVSLAMPFQIDPFESNEVKFGFLGSSKKREFEETVYQYFRINGTSLRSWPGNDFNYSFLSEPESVINPRMSSYDYAFILNPFDATDYNGTEEIESIFLMGDSQLSKNWRATYGVRWEESVQDIERTKGGTRLAIPTDAEGAINERVAMPAISLVFSPTENTNWRFAASRTVARPTFRELAPYLSYPYIGGDNYQGNPDLSMTKIRNYDLRWETFPSEGEIYAISLFYKEMRDVIVNQVQIFSDNRYVSPTNSENGTVYGIELEAKKNLGSLSSSLDNLFLNTNFTYTNAQIDFPSGMRQEMLDDRISEEFIPATRRLTGQPEYLFNLGLSYERPDLGWDTHINYGYVSSKLESISAGRTPDVFEGERHNLDLITSKKLSERWQLKFSAKNLLDTPIEKFYDTPDQFLYSSYRVGQIYSIGLSYDFD